MKEENLSRQERLWGAWSSRMQGDFPGREIEGRNPMERDFIHSLVLVPLRSHTDV